MGVARGGGGGGQGLWQAGVGSAGRQRHPGSWQHLHRCTFPRPRSACPPPLPPLWPLHGQDPNPLCPPPPACRCRTPPRTPPTTATQTPAAAAPPPARPPSSPPQRQRQPPAAVTPPPAQPPAAGRQAAPLGVRRQRERRVVAAGTMGTGMVMTSRRWQRPRRRIVLRWQPCWRRRMWQRCPRTTGGRTHPATGGRPCPQAPRSQPPPPPCCTKSQPMGHG